MRFGLPTRDRTSVLNARGGGGGTKCAISGTGSLALARQGGLSPGGGGAIPLHPSDLDPLTPRPTPAQTPQDPRPTTPPPVKLFGRFDRRPPNAPRCAFCPPFWGVGIPPAAIAPLRRSGLNVRQPPPPDLELFARFEHQDPPQLPPLTPALGGVYLVPRGEADDPAQALGGTNGLHRLQRNLTRGARLLGRGGRVRLHGADQ